MTLVETLVATPPPVRLDEDGSLRVGDSRVLLEIVIHQYQQGEDAMGIVDSYPTLTLAQAHGAIAYYLSHTAEVESYMARRDLEAEEIRRQIESDPSYIEFKERWRARIEEARGKGYGISRG